MTSRRPAGELPIFTVDAFTEEPFKGNPAAVCLVPYGKVLTDETKQKIASEMRHSETAFVTPVREGDAFEKSVRFDLRWFTPKREVSLCGHATLATSAVLFDLCGNPGPILEFQTLSGLLKAKRVAGHKVELDLPAYPSEPVDMKKYEAVVKAATGGSLPVQEVVLSQSGKLLIRLEDTVDRRQLEEFQPAGGSEMMSAAPQLEGVIVTVKGGPPYDFLSRYFAPWMGVLEDPVTGSAHSVLGPYWSKVLNKNEFRARQCSPRGGDLDIRVLEDRVAVSGRTCIVLKGHLVL